MLYGGKERVCMDVVRFRGGLGNQMFQYALVEALRDRGREVKCSLGYYRNHPNLMPFVLDQIFKNVVLNEITDEDFEEIDAQWKQIKDNGNSYKEWQRNVKQRFFWVEEDGKGQTYQEDVFNTSNCTFVGYWQSYKYFRTCSEKIRHIFCFDNLENPLRILGEKLNKDYVGVHVRRKDYLADPKYNTITIEYYQKAMKYVSDIIPEIKFIFFSDDTEWVKEHFDTENVLICSKEMFEEYGDWYDMYLMTQCVGNIIANSSFSWWGAWLNQHKNSIVIAPKKWIRNRETPDIWCESWIKM